MTVTLTSTRAILSDPYNPGGPMIACGTRRPSAATAARDGEIRSFAGGVVQVAVYDNDTLDTPVEFAALTAQQLDQIETWRGQLLLLRRVDGTRLYGAYLQVSETALPRTGLTDAAVTFSRITFNDYLDA